MRPLLLIIVACVAGCSKAPAPVANEFTAERAKALIPEAAGIPGNELWKHSEGRRDLTDFIPPNGDSLTWAVITLQVGPDTSTFFPHPVTQLNPARIANTMAGPNAKDGNLRPYESLIHPEYITDCTCTVDGDTATGTVSVKAGDVYKGQVEYTARKKDGKWRIEEVRLPDLEITTVLGADGKWVKK